MEVKLDPNWIVCNTENNPTTCLLCLPGRASHAKELVYIYKKYLGIDHDLIVGVTPIQRCWYPMPNGINDQIDAVAGINHARIIVETVVRYIEDQFSVPRENMILIGHSAGAVMAIETAAHSQRPFAGVISHNGAILEPDLLPKCQNKSTNYLLTHNRDDLIFEWEERYVPMKKALQEKGYTVFSLEEDDGGHNVSDKQFTLSRYFIDACFEGEKE